MFQDPHKSFILSTKMVANEKMFRVLNVGANFSLVLISMIRLGTLPDNLQYIFNGSHVLIG